jgi:O-succinylbenzoic acid--CoA ligase
MAEPAGPCTLLLAEAGWPALVETLTRLPKRGGVVGVAPALEMGALREALGVSPGGGPLELADLGPAVVMGSGGSTGGRRWCLQPLAQLETSAAATGTWLRGVGIDPSLALVVNPLPWHHVSGLMPWLRARQWGAEHLWLAPAQLRQPEELREGLPLPRHRPALLSLVPTQLHRLLANPAGVDWLRGFALIWVGGAPLTAADRTRAREAGLPLAPCYGSTETASMVTALPPEGFLRGQNGCGQPLPHAELRIASTLEAVEVRAASLSPGYVQAGQLRPLTAGAGLAGGAGLGGGWSGGWWRSGDRGRLDADGLTVLGRLDGAVHSGGETVWLEEVELKLRTLAEQRGLPLAALLLVPQPDPEWGQRLVALVREAGGSDARDLMDALKGLARTLPPAQRPRDWRCCQDLEPNALGKWERQRWRIWCSRQGGEPRIQSSPSPGGS